DLADLHAWHLHAAAVIDRVDGDRRRRRGVRRLVALGCRYGVPRVENFCGGSAPHAGARLRPRLPLLTSSGTQVRIELSNMRTVSLHLVILMSAVTAVACGGGTSTQQKPAPSGAVPAASRANVSM